MRVRVDQVPVEAAVVVPLRALRELASHEEELLARMRPHPAVQRAQVGELLPVVTGHPAEQRPFPVHHLVMRERQQELLGEDVHEPERELPVVPLPVDRIGGEVVERVVHPPEAPLEVEAQPAIRGARGHFRERRRLFRDHQRTWMQVADALVHFLEERVRFLILAAAIPIGDPLSGFAAVVAVEHRGDGVHAQAVDVVLLEPEERAGQQEVPHLVATVVEDQRPPVGVRALPRILVLVQRRPVEARQRVRVGREVRRYPIENHADAARVQRLDERAELVRVAVPRRGREVPRDLVPPRAAEGMFRDRQQLDMREAHVRRVIRELRARFGPRQRAISLLDDASPGTDVHFVDRHRLRERVARRRRALPQELAIAPLVPREIVHDGRRLRRSLGAKSERVGLQQPRPAATRPDLELVARARAHLGNEELPDTGGADRSHRMQPPVPGIEVPDEGYGARGRRPHRERGPVDPVVVRRVGSEALPEPLVPALGGEVAVELAQRRREAVRVAQREGRAARIADLDQIAEQVLAVVEPRLEDAAAPVHRRDASAEVRQNRHPLRVGPIRADDHAVAVGMDAEHRVRVGVIQIEQALDLLVDMRERSRAPHESSSSSRAGIETQSGRWPIS